MQKYITDMIKSIENLKDYAISGDLQPHEAFALIKEADLEGLLKLKLDEVRSFAIENLQNNFLNHNEKTFKDNSYAYTIRNGSTRYYFTDVKEVQDAKFKVESTIEFKNLKATESKYKTAFLMKQKNQIMVDEETGEVIDPSNVNVVYSPDTLSVKQLKKQS